MPDFSWFGADLNQPPWDNPECRTVSYRLDGGEAASAVDDYTLLIILNADHRLQPVQVPPADGAKHWHLAEVLLWHED